MPAVAKTSREQIVAIGRELLEEGGPDAVTMQAVAERVGVRPPSLYKHVRDRDDLLADVVAATMAELTERIETAMGDGDPRRTVVEQARLMRRFAQERPHGYGLAFGAVPGLPVPDQEASLRSLRPLLDAVARLVGEEHALDGARFVTAWANGFITMELGGAFHMGGDVGAAWEWGLERVVAALDATSPSGRPD
jgi:AcrR family transcriptional regulator